MPRLHALQFDLATPPPRSTSIIVWPEGTGGCSCPMDANQDWLDDRQGDELIVAGKRRIVSAVRVDRGEGAGNVMPLVECGREWAHGSNTEQQKYRLGAAIYPDDALRRPHYLHDDHDQQCDT